MSNPYRDTNINYPYEYKRNLFSQGSFNREQLDHIEKQRIFLAFIALVGYIVVLTTAPTLLSYWLCETQLLITIVIYFLDLKNNTKRKADNAYITRGYEVLNVTTKIRN